MSGLSTAKRIEPGEIDAEMAGRAMRRIKDYLRRHPHDDAITVDGEIGDENALIVPRAVVDLLAYILAEAAGGHGVTIFPSDIELTTQQAAEMLNVSRPHIVSLLEAGAMPFRRVGTHRRIRLDDLKNYQLRIDEVSRAAVDELSALGQELGI